MDIRDNQLHLGGLSAEGLAQAFGTPLFVYEEQAIRDQCRAMREAFAVPDGKGGDGNVVGTDIHYALKANHNPALLAILLDEGLYIDAVSPNEVRLCLEVGFKPEHILFTGNNTREDELAYCLEQGVPVNVGSLVELERFGKLSPGGRVSLRLNPDVGAGHHSHVITGGPNSKFGIYYTERAAIQDLLLRYNLTLIGIHSHIGTGILHTDEMIQAMEIVLGTAKVFPSLEFIDFGGGFGIPYRPEQEPLPMRQLGAAMNERMAVFRADYGRDVRMKLEPGRFIVGQAGILLTRVTTLHSTPAHTFVGTDSGFNHLLRPILYGAYHEVVNASMVKGDPIEAVVAGNICETGDVFTQGANGPEARAFTKPEPGHLLALLDVGAYGSSLSSNYNLRPRAAEVLVHEGDSRLIRRRESYEDLLATFVT